MSTDPDRAPGRSSRSRRSRPVASSCRRWAGGSTARSTSTTWSTASCSPPGRARPPAACSRSPAGSGSPATSSSATTRGCSAGPLPSRADAARDGAGHDSRGGGLDRGRDDRAAALVGPLHDPKRHLLDREGPPGASASSPRSTWPRACAGPRPGYGKRGCWSGAELGGLPVHAAHQVREGELLVVGLLVGRGPRAAVADFGFSPLAAASRGTCGRRVQHVASTSGRACEDCPASRAASRSAPACRRSPRRSGRRPPRATSSGTCRRSWSARSSACAPAACGSS